jgi:hypothetical protein
MTRGRHQLVEHSRVGQRPIGADLARSWAVLQGAAEKPASGHKVPLLGDQNIDDLAVLVNRRYRYTQRPATFT